MTALRLIPHVRRTAGVALAAAAVAALLLPAAAGAKEPRVLDWSGYRWTVAQPDGRADPGDNLWGRSRSHVRVQSDGTLRLDIVRGRAVELIGPATGYGRYRWVVRSDLSTVDPFRVAAFFVRGTRGERDIEFSRWGDPLLTQAGTWVTWRRRVRTGYDFFAVTPQAPYTITIRWKRRATRFRVTDVAGTTLLDHTVRGGRAGRHISPRISYWLYPGHGTSLSPYTAASAHPPVVLRSFRYRPLRSAR